MTTSNLVYQGCESVDGDDNNDSQKCIKWNCVLVRLTLYFVVNSRLRP